MPFNQRHRIRSITLTEREIKLSAGYAGQDEVQAYRELVRLMHETPIPPTEILGNLNVYLSRSALSQILFMHELYKRIIEVHGVVFELGVRWGRNLSLYSALRAIYEPYNTSRKIVGFDTFEGFPSVATEDGASESASVGRLAVTKGYEEHLGQVLDIHEKLAPRSHMKKHKIVKGDVLVTLPRYLEDHPETIIAMAYFDFDLYEPTLKCLEALQGRFTRGAVVGFDELALHEYPGETKAVIEALGLGNIRLQRLPFSQYRSFFVVE